MAKGAEVKINKEKEQEAFRLLHDKYIATNKMNAFAKMMLCTTEFRNAHVVRVQVILMDGTEIEFDDRQSKTHLNFKKKLKSK